MVGKVVKYLLSISVIIGLSLLIILPTNAENGIYANFISAVIGDTVPSGDTTPQNGDARYKKPKENVNPSDNKNNSPLYGEDPQSIQTNVEYDANSDSYIFQKTVGGQPVGTPYSMPFDDYVNYDFDKAMRTYWRQRAKNDVSDSRESFIPKLEVGGEMFDRIFGGNTIDIKPQGSAELTLGLRYDKTDNPAFDSKHQRTVTLDFDEKIQMNVVGQIGTKLKVNISYDTEASFDFENSVKLEYTGDEDDIIQKIEAGNVSLPLTGTLISGSQSLFGFKTELKFGKLTLTAVASQKRSESSTINIEGGSTTKEFEIKADDYEENKHFFLSHYFKENYDKALSALPVITGGITINRIEVWITNKTGNYTDARNIIALADLGESNNNNIQSTYVSSANGVYTTVYPDNAVNILGDLVRDYPDVRDINTASNALVGLQMVGGSDFEKIESARLLTASEYTVNTQLGYISLNTALNSDQVLAVAYEYTAGGNVYTVGEFSNSAIAAPQTLVVKLIKGTSFTPSKKSWDLMMKNVYNIGAYQVTNDDFTLNILYTNDKTGTDITYLPVGHIDSIQMLQVMGLDNLNSQLDPYPDGLFDYIEGITINSQGGRIIFPVREPFGSHLKKKITEGDASLERTAEDYVFQELYDSTQSKASQIAEKNKFKLKGKYKSSSSNEYSLNAVSIPQGSVTVTAGSAVLTENVDYTVDYNLGKVKILNQGLLEAGTPISISLESNSIASTLQTKNLIGLHANYDFSNNFNVGATILHLKEKPMTPKVNIGEEPISNTIWGLNTSYRTDVPFLTKFIDLIPGIQTKEMSTLTLNGEFAQLIPGHSKAITKEGAAYIDDFESSKITNDVKTYNAWSLASTPTDSLLFPESTLMNNREYGKNRARLSWFVVDQTLHESTSTVSLDDRSSHYTRIIYESELFPNRMSETTLPVNIAPLNLTIYPNEKGPYNFDVEGMNADGSLKNPRSRWAGIQRQLTTTDFEDANIEYIEFWLMDPFVEDSLNNGGDLYFNLGDISEDVLKDGRKSFEHGLPTPSTENPVDTTTWGIVPKTQALVNAFDDDPDNRIAQDVGMDGLSTENERSFFSDYLSAVEAAFGTSSKAYQMAYNDPSTDDYHHYKGSDYDELGLDIMTRYKYFNGLEGNSIPKEYQTETYTTHATISPDIEDINKDNTLSETENFFQYRVSLRPQDMVVGSNYIADKFESSVTLANDQKSRVTWYQFKIPISEWSKRVGSISDFKSIRFMRIFLTNFDTTTYVRFGTLDLVRGEWRKYDASFMQPGEYIVDELNATTFDVSAVNIEENANRQPVNYVLPPGVTREQNTMNPQMQLLNEQAMTIKVIDLADGDARAVYKNVYLDVRKYLKMQMFAHVESLIDAQNLNDGDLSIFVRLGTDYKNNYYEYEVPLTVTPPGYYNGDSDTEAPDRYIVWPEENDIDIEFVKLTNVKENRNALIREGNPNVGLTKLYSEMTENAKISVMGNPNLSNVQTIMIGVRNPKKASIASKDDGLPKSGEVWVNELRLTNFNEKGGWAATARASVKLADFGTLTVSGTTKKPGFGALNSTIAERLTEEANQYDVSASFELGKFFPERFNVRIPVYVSVSENYTNPEYDPLNPDVLLKNTLNDPSLSKEYKDSIKHISQDYTKRKSFNVTNVKVNGKQGKKNHIYNLSNWSASYGYNKIEQRDPNTMFRNSYTHTASIFYNYNATPKIVEPFKDVKLFKKKAFQLLREANFYYLPSQLSFRTNLNRQYGETQMRNVYNPTFELPVSVIKDFTITRQYDFKYNLTKNLKIEYTATNNARIDEPEGRLNKADKDYKEKMDSIWYNFGHFGRNTQFYQQWDGSYTLPFSKIPILNWLSASARYSGSYNWTAGAITADTINIGNTVQNSNTMSLNTQVNLLTLYNKVKYLKEVNNKYRGRTTKKKEMETVTYELKNQELKAEKKYSVTHKLKTKTITIKVTDDKGRPISAKLEVIDENRITYTVTKDVKDANVLVTGKREKKDSIIKKIIDNTLVVIMSVKNVSVNFSETNGTLLPGYLGKTHLLGLEKYTPDEAMFGAQPTIIAPTAPFIFGWQVKDFGEWACDNNLVTKDTTTIQAFTRSHSRNWNVRATLEPYRDLRIDLTLTHTLTENETKYFVFGQNGSDSFAALNPTFSGSFTMTTISIKSAFETFKKGNYESENFQRFADNRIIIANRLAQQRAGYSNDDRDEFGFPKGFSKTSQDVLMPAFLAAYTGRDPSKVTLSTIPSLWSSLPNWQIVYDGLGKIPKLKKIFRSVNLKHSYRSTYSIGSFQTRLANEYDPRSDGFNYVRDELGNFYSRYIINGVSLNEQISPLISVDVTLVNSLSAKVEIKRTRNMTMSFSNNQLTEVKNNEVVVGAGYRFKDVELVLKAGGKKRDLKSDLNLRFDFSARKQITIIRKLEEAQDQPTAGTISYTWKLSADYVLSNRFNVSLFYDQTINDPIIGLSYKTTMAKFGLTLRFTLAT